MAEAVYNNPVFTGLFFPPLVGQHHGLLEPVRLAKFASVLDKRALAGVVVAHRHFHFKRTFVIAAGGTLRVHVDEWAAKSSSQEQIEMVIDPEAEECE